MNIRIVKTNGGARTVLFEKMNASPEELPEAKTTIFILGEEKYVCRVIKAYEHTTTGGIIWHEVEL